MAIEFSENTNHKIRLLNSILNDLGVQELFENPEFAIDMDSAGYHRLVINIPSGTRRTTPLTLYLEGDGIRLDVCEVNEAFEWTNEDVFTSREQIVDFFTKVFTSYILVESCGSANSKSRIYLFDKSGSLVGKYAVRGFVQKFSGWDCEKFLFLPIF